MPESRFVDYLDATSLGGADDGGRPGGGDRSKTLVPAAGRLFENGASDGWNGIAGVGGSLVGWRTIETNTRT